MKTPVSVEGAAPAPTRTVLRRLSLSLVALAFAAFAASALAGSFAAKGAFQITSSITNSDAVVERPVYTTGRAECGGPATPFPSELVGNFHYDVYRFQSLHGRVGQAFGTCVNVSLLVQSGTAVAAGYGRTFNPLDPTVEFRGSVGGLGAGQAADFSYFTFASSTMPCGPSSAGGPPCPFDVVVYETIENGGAAYTLLVEGTGVVLTGGGPTAATGLQSFRASSAPKGVIVRWRTRSEGDALGFNLYRGTVKKVRLTRHLVRASGNGRGHSYSYLDRSARKGKSAPYYLEVVERSGSKVMFGPAVTAAR